jgi:hypothetical protein
MRKEYLLAATVVICATLITLTQAHAQWVNYHASTAAEGYGRGMGDMIRSQGQANLDNSIAAQNYAQARSMEMDNHSKWTQTYFDTRKMNREYRAAERGPRATSEALIRFAQAGAPRPLDEKQVSPYTGHIQWPRALTDPSFDEGRQTMDEIYEHRAKSEGALSRKDYATVQVTTNEMLIKLQSQISEVTSADYLEAKRFLESLAYEARR